MAARRDLARPAFFSSQPHNGFFFFTRFTSSPAMVDGLPVSADHSASTMLLASAAVSIVHARARRTVRRAVAPSRSWLPRLAVRRRRRTVAGHEYKRAITQWTSWRANSRLAICDRREPDAGSDYHTSRCRRL
jgi:hypothetical protein